MRKILNTWRTHQNAYILSIFLDLLSDRSVSRHEEPVLDFEWCTTIFSSFQLRFAVEKLSFIFYFYKQFVYSTDFQKLLNVVYGFTYGSVFLVVAIIVVAQIGKSYW